MQPDGMPVAWAWEGGEPASTQVGGGGGGGAGGGTPRRARHAGRSARHVGQQPHAMVRPALNMHPRARCRCSNRSSSRRWAKGWMPGPVGRRWFRGAGGMCRGAWTTLWASSEPSWRLLMPHCLCGPLEWRMLVLLTPCVCGGGMWSKLRAGGRGGHPQPKRMPAPTKHHPHRLARPGRGAGECNADSWSACLRPRRDVDLPPPPGSEASCLPLQHPQPRRDVNLPPPPECRHAKEALDERGVLPARPCSTHNHAAMCCLCPRGCREVKEALEDAFFLPLQHPQL
jgi:hypothetical protein